VFRHYIVDKQESQCVSGFDRVMIPSIRTVFDKKLLLTVGVTKTVIVFILICLQQLDELDVAGDLNHIGLAKHRKTDSIIRDY